VVKLLLTLLFTISCIFSTLAQEKNTAILEDDDKTTVFKFNTKYPIPKRAAFYSALIPGLGQVYNKQYWKLGIVGAGLGAAGYFIYTNNAQYKKFREAYIMRIDNNPNTVDEYVNLYQTNDLNTLQNTYRQYLEYSVVFTTVGYALNILDAYVAANLRTFDINDDISLHTKPTFENQQLGLALVLKFK
jgi:hypothetical protein